MQPSKVTWRGAQRTLDRALFALTARVLHAFDGSSGNRASTEYLDMHTCTTQHIRWPHSMTGGSKAVVTELSHSHLVAIGGATRL